MSLLQQLLANNEVELYVDFRSGTFNDWAGNYTLTKSGNSNINHKVLNRYPQGILNIGTVTVGTNDFTVVSKRNARGGTYNHVLQIGGDYFITYYSDGNDISSLINGSYFNEVNIPTANYEETQVLIGTYDRDSNMTLYIDGIHQREKDISAQASHSIYGAAMIGRTTADNACDDYYTLLINRVLTPTEVAQLTAELEGLKFPTKPWGRVSNIKPKLVGVFETSSSLDFTDLSGVTITSYEGSAILSISGNSIVATGGAGTAWNLLLSDGTYIPLEGSVNDVSGGGNHPVNNGVEFTYYGGGAFQAWSITHN